MDLDLLVPREQLLWARDLLVAAGYAPAVALSPAEEQAFLDRRLAYELYHHDRGTRLELHWSLLLVYNGSTLPSELRWRTAKPTFFQKPRCCGRPRCRYPAIGVIVQKLTDQLAGHYDGCTERWAKAALAKGSTVTVRRQKIISHAEPRSDKAVRGHRAKYRAWLMCWRSPTPSRLMLCLFLVRKTYKYR